MEPEWPQILHIVQNLLFSLRNVLSYGQMMALS